VVDVKSAKIKLDPGFLGTLDYEFCTAASVLIGTVTLSSTTFSRVDDNAGKYGRGRHCQ